VGSRYGLEIRAANAGDAQGLSELMAAAGLALAPAALAERLDAMRQAPGVVLIAQEWGPPSGVIAVTWHPTLLAERPVAQVTTLLVGPDERRRGIGRLLLKSASQAARNAGCGSLELTANSADPSLQGFCEATGFAAVGGRFERPLRKKG
jgi:GNAT superfamily N-acetyltransferase